MANLTWEKIGPQMLRITLGDRRMEIPVADTLLVEALDAAKVRFILAHEMAHMLAELVGAASEPVDFAQKAAEDQKSADYPACCQGFMRCRSQTCGCMDTPEDRQKFITARAELYRTGKAL